MSYRTFMPTKQESITFLIAPIMNITTETVATFVITLMITFENFTAFLITQKLCFQLLFLELTTFYSNSPFMLANQLNRDQCLTRLTSLTTSSSTLVFTRAKNLLTRHSAVVSNRLDITPHL